MNAVTTCGSGCRGAVFGHITFTQTRSKRARPNSMSRPMEATVWPGRPTSRLASSKWRAMTAGSSSGMPLRSTCSR